MAAQRNDVLYAERLSIPGKISADDILKIHENDTIDNHVDVNIVPGTAQDGDSIVIVGGILVRKPRPIIIEKSGWQRTTQDYDSPITDETDPNTNVAIRITEIFPELGLWKPTISFIAACNSTGANFEADCTINGNTLVKSNPISSKIIAQEGKDAAGQHTDFSGNATGAGTDNIRPVTLICNTIDITQASNEIVLTYGCDGNNIIASISEITIQFERVYNTTQI